MAIVIPDGCPSKASAGEKRLFNLFRDLLPDNFTVWHEPVVAELIRSFKTLGLRDTDIAVLYARQGEDPEFIEMKRKDNLRRAANELLLLERAKEWLLERSDSR